MQTVLRKCQLLKKHLEHYPEARGYYSLTVLEWFEIKKQFIKILTNHSKLHSIAQNYINGMIYKNKYY